MSCWEVAAGGQSTLWLISVEKLTTHGCCWCSYMPPAAVAAPAAVFLIFCVCISTVRELVALLTGQLGYSSICLVADKEEPHVVSLYKVLFFHVLCCAVLCCGVLCFAARCFAPAILLAALGQSSCHHSCFWPSTPPPLAAPPSVAFSPPFCSHADNSTPQGLGFEIMDELHSLRRPEEEDGPPTATTTTTTTSAPQAPGAAAGDGDATLN